MQDVLSLRDAPSQPPVVISQRLEARVPTHQHRLQEMEAPTRGQVGSGERSDGPNQTKLRLLMRQHLPPDCSYDWAPANYLTLPADRWTIGIARFDQATASAWKGVKMASRAHDEAEASSSKMYHSPMSLVRLLDDHGWMDGWMDGWMCAWMDAWMSGCVHV